MRNRRCLKMSNGSTLAIEYNITDDEVIMKTNSLTSTVLEL